MLHSRLYRDILIGKVVVVVLHVKCVSVDPHQEIDASAYGMGCSGRSVLESFA